MIPAFDRSPNGYARVGGALYLAIILLGLFGEAIVRGSMVVVGDPAATARAIEASPLLWRAGIVGDLLMQVCDVPLIVIMYLLLRPVHHGLALFATAINVVQTAVLAINKLTLLLPLLLLKQASLVHAFTPDQLHALSQLAINAHGRGFAIGLLFFGVACLVRGYLIFHCGFLPKALGVLMAVAGMSYLLNTLALLLAPQLAAAMFPAVLLPAFVGEFSLCLWLLVKGIDVEAWEREKCASAARAGEAA